MSRMASGELFEKEVRQSLIYKMRDTNKLWFKKLVDTNAIRGYSEVAHTEGNWGFKNMLAPKVPSDFLLVYHGRPIFIECKSSHGELSYNMIDYVKDHQCIEARDITAAGGLYYFMICNKSKRGEDSKTYILPGSKVFWMRRDLVEQKKRSVKWDKLEEISHFILSKRMQPKLPDDRPANPWPMDFLDEIIKRRMDVNESQGQ